MSTLAPIGLQLYTLRDVLTVDFGGTIQQVAEIGFVAVEPFSRPTDHRLEARIIGDHGLAVPSIHAPLPVGSEQQALDMAAAYGCQYLISGLGPEHFKTFDDVRRACDRFNEASRIASEHGFRFGIHNHWWEFLQIDGRPIYQIMLTLLDPGIVFQIDVYWVQTAGLDPAAIVREFGPRAPLLHVKDGPANRDDPMTAVGEGALNVTEIVEASVAEWLIVELDQCATDMMRAVEKSYDYLEREGLGRG